MSEAEPPVMSVTDLTFIMKEFLESAFPAVSVAGEISGMTRAASGHVYFTLKDESAQIKAIMWKGAAGRLPFALHDGLQVVATGGVELYPQRGQYQLIVQQLVPQGIGPLELAFRQMQVKLAAEGLFDKERKRPLPLIPRRVALITSPTGAAVRDMLQVMTRRWPGLGVVVVPVPVQGEGAAAQIAQALLKVHKIPDVDVVICGRGGGSLEDLWAFNEEVVARAIAACQLPVISAVGHEIDVTIADLVADRRALTPSEAAEIVVPIKADVLGSLDLLERQLTTHLRQPLLQARQQLSDLAQRRVLTRPFERVQLLKTQMNDTEHRLRRSLAQLVERSRERLAQASVSLQALSPLGVLERGYSMTKRLPDGLILREAAAVRPGDVVSTLLADGELISRIIEVRTDAAPPRPAPAGETSGTA